MSLLLSGVATWIVLQRLLHALILINPGGGQRKMIRAAVSLLPERQRDDSDIWVVGFGRDGEAAISIYRPKGARNLRKA